MKVNKLTRKKHTQTCSYESERNLQRKSSAERNKEIKRSRESWREKNEIRKVRGSERERECARKGKRHRVIQRYSFESCDSCVWS